MTSASLLDLAMIVFTIAAKADIDEDELARIIVESPYQPRVDVPRYRPIDGTEAGR